MTATILLSLLIALMAGTYAWVLFGDSGDDAEMERYRRERDAFERLFK